ncbi:MAG: hypothetical protein LBD91_00960 [Prevotellaceae bacterium]|jgi:hypothetical protein|nr:hypothetical protein [Prevotellaceae bacterium]
MNYLYLFNNANILFMLKDKGKKKPPVRAIVSFGGKQYQKHIGTAAKTGAGTTATSLQGWNQSNHATPFAF